MNRHELYRPLLERTPENHQVQYLARRYDFGQESRIAALIAAEVNRRMDEVEVRLGVQRARPFELCLHRGGRDVTLPLFRPEYLEPILAGSTFAEARKLYGRAYRTQHHRTYPWHRAGRGKEHDPQGRHR